MMSILEHICQYAEQTGLAIAISQSAWLFPLIESAHVIALVLVIGSISMIDLRLIGVALPQRDVAELTHEILPWTWGAFTLAAITGTLLFASAATRYLHLLPVMLKFLLLAAAGLNMMLFHLLTYRRVHEWGSAERTPFAARLAGTLSLVLWIGVVACGRWIGFV